MQTLNDNIFVFILIFITVIITILLYMLCDLYNILKF